MEKSLAVHTFVDYSSEEPSLHDMSTLIHLCLRAGSAELLNFNCGGDREWGDKSNDGRAVLSSWNQDVLLALLYDETTKSTHNLWPERSSAH